ncbi:MAG: hypothetical protein SNJ77_01425 [Cytophagales bacterium]
MKNIFIIFLSVFLINANYLFAQQNNVELARVAFISQKIKLSSEQAQLFWPLYNEFNDKKTTIKTQMKKLSLENLTEKTTDEIIISDIKKLQQLKQKEVDIEKEFTDKCLKILSPRQFAELYQAEREFKLILIKKLGEGQ